MIAETFQDQLAKTIRYVRPVDAGQAMGLVSQVYQQLRADFMPAPLVTLHAPLPQVLAGVWSMLRETLLAGQANRVQKEVVAVTVSKTNECPFCVDAHTVMLQAASGHNAAAAIQGNRYDTIQDVRLQALAQWVFAHQTAPARRAEPPFAPADAPEMVGTVVAFHYLNRMANIFLGDSLLPLPDGVKEITYRVYALTAGKRIIRALRPGDALKFLPPEALPEDLSWAAGSSTVAGAFARMAAAIESARQSVLPEAVRRLVIDRVHAWRGEAPGFSRSWVEPELAGVEPGQQSAARLALLTALASYQVDERVVAAFRAQNPHDEQLIGVTAWASFTAARRVGEWYR